MYMAKNINQYERFNSFLNDECVRMELYEMFTFSLLNKNLGYDAGSDMVPSEGLKKMIRDRTGENLVKTGYCHSD